MLFNTVAATLLGVSSLVAAAPRPIDDASPAARGLVWEPKAVKNRLQKKNVNVNIFDESFFDSEDFSIEIVDTTIVELNEDSRKSENDLTILVQAQIDISNGYNNELQNFRDNVRKNHYRNRNSDSNTVVVVVTEIIDIREESNRNTRYVTRHVTANNNRNSFTSVIVQEVVAISIDAEFSSSFFAGYAPTGTASAGASMQTVSSSAPYLNSNDSQLLPPQQSFPNFAEQQSDPAAIVEVDQIDIFVEVVEESNSNSNSNFENESNF